MAFGQNGSRALIAAVLGGPLADLGALVFGDRVKPIPARFTAGQDVAGVELAGGAPAVGFSAPAPEQVKGALDHRLGALEPAQGVGQGGVSAPELLAEFGEVSAQSASFIY
jgi:hypothetical protein